MLFQERDNTGIEPIASDNLNYFHCLQNAFHIANNFFGFHEDSKLYLPRKSAHVVVNKEPFKIRMEAEQISLLTEDEILEQVHSINFLLLQQSVDKIASHLISNEHANQNTSNLNTDANIISQLYSRLNSLSCLLKQIIFLDPNTKQRQDKIITILWSLNELFKDESGKSMPYSKVFVSFLAKTHFFDN
ncbi:MAG: hypothetical protein ACOZAN_02785 [Patescibacteria group bacterium]